MRLLITGSRDWTDQPTIGNLIVAVMTEFAVEHGLDWNNPDWVTIVHGDCPTGADAMADEFARKFGYKVESHPADWSVGKKAGYIRNKKMVDLGADVCLAFIKNNSKGATMTVDLAQKAGIKTTILRSE